MRMSYGIGVCLILCLLVSISFLNTLYKPYNFLSEHKIFIVVILFIGLIIFLSKKFKN